MTHDEAIDQVHKNVAHLEALVTKVEDLADVVIDQLAEVKNELAHAIAWRDALATGMEPPTRRAAISRRIAPPNSGPSSLSPAAAIEILTSQCAGEVSAHDAPIPPAPSEILSDAELAALNRPIDSSPHIDHDARVFDPSGEHDFDAGGRA